MATVCEQSKPWRNRRKRSLYNREGGHGFIYRDMNTPPEDTTTAVKEVTMDTDKDAEIEELRRQTEVERFLDLIRRGVASTGCIQTEEQLEESFRQLAEDLAVDNLYMRCLEEPDRDRSAQQSREEDRQLGEMMTSIRASMDRYKRELSDWEYLLEERKEITERAKAGYTKERHLDFLRLPTRDEEPLKSFLTPEQLSMLDTNSKEFVMSTYQKLDNVESRLDEELARLSSLCGERHQANVADQSVLKCTPSARTLFGAYKDSDDFNQTLT